LRLTFKYSSLLKVSSRCEQRDEHFPTASDESSFPTLFEADNKAASITPYSIYKLFKLKIKKIIFLDKYDNIGMIIYN